MSKRRADAPAQRSLLHVLTLIQRLACCSCFILQPSEELMVKLHIQ